jgi:hypothetical protein
VGSRLFVVFLLTVVGFALGAAGAGFGAHARKRPPKPDPVKLIKIAIAEEERAIDALELGLTMTGVRAASAHLDKGVAALNKAGQALSNRAARNENGQAIGDDGKALDDLDTADEVLWEEGFYEIDHALYHKYRALAYLGHPVQYLFTLGFISWWDHANPGVSSNNCLMIVTTPKVKYGYGSVSAGAQGPRARSDVIGKTTQTFVLDKNGTATVKFGINAFGKYKFDVTVYSHGKKVTGSFSSEVTSAPGTKSCR